jgi:hypothetical protein
MGESSPFELAERLRECFAYLMEVPLQEQDYKVIERFDQFIRGKLLELDNMKLELKAMLQRLTTDYRGSQGIGDKKVTYQSLYFTLKQTAEVLGGLKTNNNNALTNLDSNVLQQRIIEQREQLKEVIHFVDDEINELEVIFYHFLIV